MYHVKVMASCITGMQKWRPAEVKSAARGGVSKMKCRGGVVVYFRLKKRSLLGALFAGMLPA